MPINMTYPLAGKRIWLTGGNGFLGLHVKSELEERGAVVLAPTEQELDLLDPYAAVRFLRANRPNGVIHLAARVGGIGANRKHPGNFFYSNLVMGVHLIEACRTEGTEKLLVLGTVCAYPKHCPVPFSESDLWDGYPEETNAPYGIAKKALLVQLQSYRKEYGTRGIYLIPVNLYGPGDHLDIENNHVIPALIIKFLEADLLRKPSVEIWGTGESSREFLFVRDAAVAICDGMSNYEGDEPVNLGTGEEITIKDLASKIKAIIGYQGELIFNPSYPDGQPRPKLNISRAKEGFNWQARCTLDQGLPETIKWIRKKLYSES